MDEVKLLPCPRCCKTPSIEKRDVEPQGDPWYGKKLELFVLCECGLCLFDEYFHDGFINEEAAIAAWNTRPTLVTDELVERRVAKAIAEKHWDNACTCLGTPNYARGSDWKEWVPTARAAIDAMPAIPPQSLPESLGAIPGSREPDPSFTGSGPSGFDPERGERS